MYSINVMSFLPFVNQIFFSLMWGKLLFYSGKQKVCFNVILKPNADLLIHVIGIDNRMTWKDPLVLRLPFGHNVISHLPVMITVRAFKVYLSVSGAFNESFVSSWQLNKLINMKHKHDYYLVLRLNIVNICKWNSLPH